MSNILLLLCSAFVAFAIRSYAANHDKILLNCGSSNTILSQDGREFVGDHEYKFTAPNSTEAATSSGPFLPSETLCKTARLFTEKSTYTIPISDTTHKHFLRLHFYTSSYNTHNLSDAVFSVNCGPYVLLHNFTAATLKHSYVVFEFCIPVNKLKHLDIIFTPEENNPKSYAFINAMEVLSVPNMLLVRSVILPRPNFQQNPFSINVRDQTTFPSDDKYGRSCVKDSWFIIRIVMDSKGQNSSEIQHTNLFARNEIYVTYSSMDRISLISLNSNLTWVFSKIDANFSYLVCLHFCELQLTAAKGPVSIIICRMHKGHTMETISGSFTVAAMPCLMVLCCALKRKNKNSKGSHDKPFSGVGDHGGGSTSTITTTSAHNTESNASTGSYSYVSISVGSISCRYFSFSEILDATNNFDDSVLLGVGGFGKVYRGEISGGIKIAVKRANPHSLQGSAEFKNEIDLLSRLRHKNLVYLIGYCDENSEMCLVYDYASNGTLAKHIHGKENGSITLSWKQRVEICIGAAKGLDYLHSGAFQTVIHRDVKSSNILLDENLSAKVSDFGLCKAVETFDQSHVTTVAKGSYGYMDPQYFYRMTLTKKSDVYSFGVLLFEVLCAKPAVMSTQSRKKMNLSDYALEHLRRGALEEIIDPNLIGDITSDSLLMFAEVGEKCLAEEGDERPTMADVVWYLEFSLQLHETATCERKTTCGVISEEV